MENDAATGSQEHFPLTTEQDFGAFAILQRKRTPRTDQTFIN